MQHLGGRGRVGVRAVHRLDRGAEVARERAELQVRNFVADEPARERDRVDPAVGEPRVAVLDERGVEEAGSRTGCCGRRSPRRARTSRNAGSTSAIRGAGSTIASVIPVSTVIIGGIGTPGFTNVSKRPSSSPPRMRERADLGDRVGARVTRRSSRGRRPRTSPPTSGIPRSSSVCCRGGSAVRSGAGAKPDSTGANGEVGATEREDSEHLFVAKVCSCLGAGRRAAGRRVVGAGVPYDSTARCPRDALSLRSLREPDPFRRRAVRAARAPFTTTASVVSSRSRKKTCSTSGSSR